MHPIAMIDLEHGQGPGLLSWGAGWLHCLRLEDNETWAVMPVRTLEAARLAVARTFRADAWGLEFVEPRADVPF